jgi:hypothetical protein
MASTQVTIMILLFGIAFGIPMVRFIYILYKRYVEARLIAAYNILKSMIKDTMDGKSGDKKKKKGAAKTAAKVAPAPPAGGGKA